MDVNVENKTKYCLYHVYYRLSYFDGCFPNVHYYDQSIIRNYGRLARCTSHQLHIDWCGGLTDRGGVNMHRKDETPEERRERLRHEELKNRSSSIHGSNLADLVGSVNFKGTGSLLVIAIIFLIIMFIIFR